MHPGDLAGVLDHEAVHGRNRDEGADCSKLSRRRSGAHRVNASGRDRARAAAYRQLSEAEYAPDKAFFANWGLAFTISSDNERRMPDGEPLLTFPSPQTLPGSFAWWPADTAPH